MLRAVTSPALPVNSPNAIDGNAFILQFVVAATVSNANIQIKILPQYQHITEVEFKSHFRILS